MRSHSPRRYSGIPSPWTCRSAPITPYANPLSAQSVDALRERARVLMHRLAGADPCSWADIAYT
ncbi:hypothetical protein, partial [Streptomyces zhihengii]